MDTILYFQSPSKTSAPDKIAGVRRHAAAADWHVQVVDGIPSPNALAGLVAFWHPLGVIVECGGGYQEIPPDLFAGLPTVYLDRNPRTMPADTSCVSHDSVATGLLAAKEPLKNSSLDVSAIANFCGFKAANALWKFFRQETGASPSEWRKSVARHL